MHKFIKILNIQIAMLFLTFFTACNTKERPKIPQKQDNSIYQNSHREGNEHKEHETEETNNHFTYQDITWNQGFSLSVDYQILKSKFPSIYTKEKPEIYDMLLCDSMAYINESELQKCSSNVCNLINMHFDETMYQISVKEKIISQNTSISELANMFPECETLKELTLGLEKPFFKSCLIRSRKQDFGILILISNDKITEVEIWMPS